MFTVEGTGFMPGCGQFEAQTHRSGLAAANARANALTSAYFGGPAFDVSYGAESLTQHLPLASNSSNAANAGCVVGTGSRNLPLWSMTTSTGKRDSRASYCGNSRPSSCIWTCQP